MRRNSLQGLANTLAEMAVASGAGSLFDTAADLPDGTLHIDLLTRVARMHDREFDENPVVDRLSEWLAERVTQSRGTTWPSLLLAEIAIELKTGPVPTIRESIVWYLVKPDVTLRTKHQTVRATRPVENLWIRRGNPPKTKE